MTNHPTKGTFDLTRAEWRRPGAEETEGTAGSEADGHVEIAFVDDLIGMRDSRHPDGPVLVFTTAEWDAFVAGAKDGEFDLP